MQYTHGEALVKVQANPIGTCSITSLLPMERLEDSMEALAKTKGYKGFNCNIIQGGCMVSLQYTRGEALAKVEANPIGSWLTF